MSTTYLSLRLNEPLDAIQLSSIQCDMHRRGFELFAVGGGGEYTHDYDFEGPEARMSETQNFLIDRMKRMNLDAQILPGSF